MIQSSEFFFFLIQRHAVLAIKCIWLFVTSTPGNHYLAQYADPYENTKLKVSVNVDIPL